MNLTGKTCGPWKVDRLGRLRGPKGHCMALEFTVAQLDGRAGKGKRKFARAALLPLRRLGCEPRLPDHGHHSGWAPGVDVSDVLGPFREERRAVTGDEKRAARRKA